VEIVKGWGEVKKLGSIQGVLPSRGGLGVAQEMRPWEGCYCVKIKPKNFVPNVKCSKLVVVLHLQSCVM
jgi:hypothetical protein